jgi:hypothetical protein
LRLGSCQYQFRVQVCHSNICQCIPKEGTNLGRYISRFAIGIGARRNSFTESEVQSSQTVQTCFLQLRQSPPNPPPPQHSTPTPSSTPTNLEPCRSSRMIRFQPSNKFLFISPLYSAPVFAQAKAAIYVSISQTHHPSGRVSSAALSET